ncbi:MAG: proline hydroxylase [Phenylobacterium sp.]|uniref:2OG-Fe(II) oxygenase n=1 Tax=Phenylobacterium sp. TaxID=1871053 RepID=UPI0025D256CC|nr:2OG-Fe(II) oxygenase family protein [Phenylobacterium sp.]MBI1197062.1 proline hydroxylase [Phenylobacterium sp.]
MTDIRIQAGRAPEPFAEGYRRDGVVQVPGFLEPAAAEAVGDLLARLPYVIVAPDAGGETLVISDEVLRRFGEQQVRAFLQDTLKRAASGFAFIHQSYALQDEYARAPDQPVARVTEFLQSRTFLDFGQALTGERIDGVRVQASNYRRGDFLTLHDDSHGKDDRVAAFTLGFTRGWRPDWGGQLLFHDARGDVVRGFAPRFNVLTVFRTPQPHSVAAVAAYAAAPRLSLTGWFVRERG